MYQPATLTTDIPWYPSRGLSTSVLWYEKVNRETSWFEPWKMEISWRLFHSCPYVVILDWLGLVMCEQCREIDLKQRGREACHARCVSWERKPVSSLYLHSLQCKWVLLCWVLTCCVHAEWVKLQHRYHNCENVKRSEQFIFDPIMFSWSPGISAPRKQV